MAVAAPRIPQRHKDLGVERDARKEQKRLRIADDDPARNAFESLAYGLSSASASELTERPTERWEERLDAMIAAEDRRAFDDFGEVRP